MAKKLRDKQERFCREYIIDLKAAPAAERAGYSPRSACNIGPRLLTEQPIKDRIAELMGERMQRVEVDADYVLRQAVKLHERCMQEVEPYTDRRGEQLTDEKGNKLYVFDSKGAASALRLVGDHINVQAFKQRIEHSGSIENLTDEELEARLARLIHGQATAADQGAED
jgi:phage terminase small subunit